MSQSGQAERHEKEIFERAIELDSPPERLAFVKGACGTDAELLARVQTLLKAHEASEAFLPEQSTALATILNPLVEKRGDRIGRYKLREKIGEGGCGVVYVAEQEEPVRRRVALKIIKLGMDTRQVIARFEAERQALAMMDHPNIAKVLDGGATETGRPYFVMELVRGVKITDYCDQNQLSTVQRLELFVQVCHAVQHAHQKGIIHRDLKPSNILVTLHDGEPVPKVIDFGIAKATEGRLGDLTVYTELHQFIGTPAYMSPEQAEMSGLDIDTRSDIYSLGVLLYELLTGRTPFDAKELLQAGFDQIRRTIREIEPPRPSTRLSTLADGDLTTIARARSSEPPKLIHLVRGDLDWIVMKALEKNRMRRYETANGLAMDLKRHLTNEPVIARPPSRAYRFQKLVRRNKLAFAAATAIAISLVAGIVVSAWQATRATRAERAENSQRRAAQQARETAEQQRRLAEDNLYAADMLATRQAFGDYDKRRALELLNKYIPGRPVNAPSALTFSRDLRGWEWRYLWREGRSDELAGFELPSARSVAFSPDGGLLVAAGEEIIVWDVKSHRPVARLPVGANQIAVSAHGILAAINWDETVRLWDLSNHIAALHPLAHSEMVRSLAFSPDGRFLATACTNSTWLWDVASHRATQIGIGDGFRLAFAPDGETLAIAQKLGEKLVLWSVRSNQVAATCRCPKFGGTDGSLAWSPDGNWLAAGFMVRNPSITVWDARLGSVLTDFVAHAVSVDSVVFAAGGKILASGGSDQTIKLWDVSNWQLLATLKGHAGVVSALAISRNGSLLASAGRADGAVKLWNAEPKPVETSTLNFLGLDNDWRPPYNTHYNWALSPDGRSCLTVQSNGTYVIWDTATLRQTEKAQPLPSTNLSSIALATNRLVAFGTWDGRVLVPGAAFRELHPPQSGAGRVRGLAFARDGGKLAALFADLTVAVWDAVHGQLITRFPGPPVADPSQIVNLPVLAFSPDGELLAASHSNASDVHLWDFLAKAARSPLRTQAIPVLGCAFSEDGKRVATVGAGAATKVWNLDHSADPIITLPYSYSTAVAFSLDGRRLAVRGGDDSIKIWDMETQTALEVAHFKSPFLFRTLAFLPDDETLVGACDEGLQIWRASSLREGKQVRQEGK